MSLLRQRLLLAAGLLLSAQAALGQTPEAGPRFREAKTQAGLPDSSLQVKWIDLSGNGWPELLLGDADGRWRLFRRQGRARAGRASARFPGYEEVAGVGQQIGTSHLLIAGDVDNDGDLDLFSAGYAVHRPGTPPAGPGRILLQRGRGELAFEARDDALAAGRVTAACFVDLDRDGQLDLFTGAWFQRFGKGLESDPDRYFRGRGTGAFEDRSQARGLLVLDGHPGDVVPAQEQERRRFSSETKQKIGRFSQRPTYGVAAADWDNDGDPDLFGASYGRQWNTHWENQGDGELVEIGLRSRFDGDEERSGVYPDWSKKYWAGRGITRRDEYPFRSNGNTFGIAFGDYDNDGDLDCALSEITHCWAGPSSDVSRVLTNTGQAGGWTFETLTPALERVHTRRDWNQGDKSVAWFDADNDGDLDLLIGSCEYPDHQFLELFLNEVVDGRRRLRRVSEQAGIRVENAYALSLADFDRDGDVDLAVTGGRGQQTQVHLLENRAERLGHHFLSLRLEGQQANRQGIGARVRLTTVSAGQRVTQTREVSAGHGHHGQQDDPRLVFGLGQATRVERLEVRWCGPERTVDVYRDLPADRFLTVTEGAETPKLGQRR